MKRNIKIPENAAQTDELIRKIADLQKKGNKVAEEANTRIKEIRNCANKEIRALEDQISELASAIFDYYLKNKKELTVDGKLKIVKLCEGYFWEYFIPGSVRIVREEQNAIKELIKRGLREFIRIKKEVDKEAIQRRPGKIEGMKYIKISEKKKKFSVTPNDTGISATIGISKK